MPMKIVVLEDDAPRRQLMEVLLRDRFRQFEFQLFTCPQSALNYLKEHLHEAILVSLDHDMELLTDSNGVCHDPGTGREVADYLATQPPSCPVIIHSSNAAATIGMQQTLEDAGWNTSVVAPYDDLKWIGESWFPAVRRAIVDSARPIGASNQARAD